MARTSRPRSGSAALPTTFATPAGAVAAARTSTLAEATVPTQGARRPTAAPTPLGSLVTASARADAGCPRCGAASVTRLAMTAADGAPVTFVSCHACESRTWLSADGATLGLGAVLGRSADA